MEESKFIDVCSDTTDISITVNPEDVPVDLTFAETSYEPEEIDKIRVVFYKKGKVFDSYSMNINPLPKSKLCQKLIAVANKILEIRNSK